MLNRLQILLEMPLDLKPGINHDLKSWLLTFWLCVFTGSQLIILNLIFLICQRGMVCSEDTDWESQPGSFCRQSPGLYLASGSLNLLLFPFCTCIFSFKFLSRKQVPHPHSSFQFPEVHSPKVLRKCHAGQDSQLRLCGGRGGG